MPYLYSYLQARTAIDVAEAKTGKVELKLEEFNSSSNNLLKEIKQDANDAISKVGSKISSKIDKELKYVNKNKIDQHIAYLSSVEEIYERIGIDFLIILSNDALNFEQIYKLTKVILQKNITDKNRSGVNSFIQRFIIHEKSEIAEDFVKNYSIKADDELRVYSIHNRIFGCHVIDI